MRYEITLNSCLFSHADNCKTKQQQVVQKIGQRRKFVAKLRAISEKVAYLKLKLHGMTAECSRWQPKLRTLRSNFRRKIKSVEDRCWQKSGLQFQLIGYRLNFNSNLSGKFLV